MSPVEPGPLAQALKHPVHREPIQSVVIDTNVVLDMSLFEDPRVEVLKQKLQARRLLWLATAAMREELVRVLTYPHLVAKAEHKDLQRGQPLGRTLEQVLQLFDAGSQCCEPAPKARFICKDADDQKFIDLAAEQGAMLISKDKAVLALTKRLARLGVKVCNTSEMPFDSDAF
jgi:putative PIN family toxin of toxin-antitoxin system